jgi:hypothetical protein
MAGIAEAFSPILALFQSKPTYTGPLVEFWKDPERCGWLMKQGEHIKTWRRRWFVLKSGHIFWFKSDDVTNQSQPRGCIEVKTCLSVKGAEDAINKPFAFEISTRHAAPKNSAGPALFASLLPPSDAGAPQLRHLLLHRGQRQGEGGLDQRNRARHCAPQQLAHGRGQRLLNSANMDACTRLAKLSDDCKRSDLHLADSGLCRIAPYYPSSNVSPPSPPSTFLRQAAPAISSAGMSPCPPQSRSAAAPPQPPATSRAAT